jgi:hypothetical protein
VLEEHSYLDESGIHDGAEVCMISGFFGDRRQWDKLEKKWMRRLNSFRVPLHEFHAKDLVNCNGFFFGWSEEKSLKLQTALAESIAQHKIYPLSYGIIVKDFLALPLNKRRFLTGATLMPSGKLKGTGNPNKPYFAPFQPVIKRALSYAPQTGRAHFYFGLGTPFSGYATDLYSTLRKNPDHPFSERFGDISFPMAKQNPALQAADFHCYLSYSYLLERSKPNRWHMQPSDVIKLLLTNIKDPSDACFQDGQQLLETLEQIPLEDQGDLLVEDLAG